MGQISDQRFLRGPSPTSHTPGLYTLTRMAYRAASMGRMGFGEVELLGEQENIIVVLFKIERGTYWAVKKET